MRYVWLLLLLFALLLPFRTEVEQAIESGRQVVEAGRQMLLAGKELADSEVAQQLQTFLQEKYDSSAPLRQAMFSGDGKLLAEELKKTELANFSFYRSELLDVEFRGKLTGDGTFQVLRYQVSQPSAEPTIIKEFQVFLDNSGEVQVEQASASEEQLSR
ncbi:hypothetical protein LOK74_15320 [Brevibacillus humidisoli]|uniref:hypothetical protein n=1 Tax=Brevibacillus humidisoli TaxID=2895522 RepID=UPI001E4415DB|nr:hypothetical protein [Brevibacillus humidisoli]UFJ39429.1 hypothetical protein LOK74_15320 [Brevibacillus humidisoli]